MRSFHLFQLGLWVCGFTLTSCQLDDRSASRESSQAISFLYYQNAEYERDCEDIRLKCIDTNTSGVYFIRPEGYPQPFEVYCHINDESGGWTVIQRRLDGSVTFNRQWEDYKAGFGFLKTEYWLGNEKLAYMTNQAVYELRIDVLFVNGSELHVSYDQFRISDEFSNYSLTHVGLQYIVGDFTPCPADMVYRPCTCPLTCKDPAGLNTDCIGYEDCVCPNGLLFNGNRCVAPNECLCFIHDEDTVVPEEGSLVNSDCTVKYTCFNQTLTANSAYNCDPNAECKVLNQVQECFCRERFHGNGESCRKNVFTDCLEAYNDGHRENGEFTILPSEWSGLPFKASCNMETDGGGWMVIQRRSDGSTDFYRNWESYKQGFGNVSNEYWLGNEKLHFITSQRNHLIRIDVITRNGTQLHDRYASFVIANENTGYRVSAVGTHTGTGGDGFHRITGESFSTYDRDNDGWLSYNCAEKHKGAWWYSDNWTYCYNDNHCNYFRQDGGNCRHICTRANPNGEYGGGHGTNIFWYDYYPCYVRYVEMKIRPS